MWTPPLGAVSGSRDLLPDREGGDTPEDDDDGGYEPMEDDLTE
jgi:hypothetical protein